MTKRLFRDLMFQNPLTQDSVKFFDLCEKKFNNFVIETDGFQKALSPSCLIPKIVHLIWLGPRSYPEYAFDNLKQWLKINPNYQFFLWTDDPFFETFPIDHICIKRLSVDFSLKFLQKEYDQNSSYAAKSDILRLELLYEYGGFYTDYDNRCCKNLDIFSHSCEFLGAFECEARLNIMPDPVSGEFMEPRVSNCLVGSKQKHPAFIGIFEKIQRAHLFFEKISKTILIHQVVYATYIHFALGFKDYVLKNGGDFIILPTYLAWRHCRGKLMFETDYDPFFEINYLDSVGWCGEYYDFMQLKNQFV